MFKVYQEAVSFMGKVPLKAIIFDFDGVICESVQVKTEAFRRLFRRYPQHLDRIITYHMDNGGISRYKKFKVIYRDFLKKKLTAQESEKLGKRFTNYSLHLVLKSAFVKGAILFLRRYHRKLLFFVVSGTPQEEIRYIAQRRGLSQFFGGIYGSPSSKHILIKKILRENALRKNSVWYVGDSRSDEIEAKKAGVFFIGRLHQVHSNPFRNISPRNIINDFGDFENLVEPHYVKDR